MQNCVLFNDDWSFTKKPLGMTIDAIHEDISVFAPVEIPHDWLIYDTADLYENSQGWYRKVFTMKKEENEHVFIKFDGVYMDSTVYVNGTAAGEWKYGYSTFRFDITKLLVDGENEIIVRVVYKNPNSRWYSGAGIFRDVWLITEPSSYIVMDGTYVSTVKKEDTDERWDTMIDTEISISDSDLAAYENGRFMVRQSVAADDGTLVSASINEELNKTRIFNAFTGHEDFVYANSQTLPVKEPVCWDIDNPYQYVLKTELLLDGKVIDVLSQNIGFRTAVFSPEEGFLLNGRHVKLHGVCLHHDLGALGAAFNINAAKRQLEIMKKMGVNAIRTSHNMPAPGLVDLCCSMGILIDCESFDMWERAKTEFDYSRFFKTWSRRDVASWVRRDRNRPAIIMWSIGNEIYDTHADDHGQEITKKLMGYVHMNDPRHNAMVTIGSNYMPWDGAQKCADIVKLAGYNYAEKYYDEHHVLHPDWIIYGSETGSTVQSRGIYHFPAEISTLADDDEQCSSLGNSTTSWGAKSIQDAIIDDRDAEYCCGQFVWSGFDYIGEPTPYHTKNSYFGMVDTAGFEKDGFYSFAAEWTSYKENPFVHICPYWNFNEGQIIDVSVVSNAPKIELFVNGSSAGTFDFDHEHGKKLVASWKIPYKKGVLNARAYDENGDIIAEDEEKSFGDAANISVKTDKDTLKADGSDIIFAEISMTDRDGNEVKNANSRVDVSVKGAGRLVGLDNGDSTDFDQYKGTSRRLFSGKLLAMIQAKNEPGDIKLMITSEGLMPFIATYKAVSDGRPVKTRSGVVLSENEQTVHERDIPVRQIVLENKDGFKFDENKREMDVKISLLPENASYDDLTVRITNENGIDSNIACCTMKAKDTVHLEASGDGRFVLRVMAKNGTDRIHIISQLTYDVTGLGSATLNPYEFIAGGLYDVAVGEVGTGNERGIATAPADRTVVGFTNVDFGDYGSDEITIPIFSLDDSLHNIKLYTGVPSEEGSELIGELLYQKPSIWNVYQAETYRLKKRIRGIQTICLETADKIHIKGFSFKQYDKSYAQIGAKENSNIYGDTFTIGKDSITGIGNNVSLVFKNFDFSVKGTSKLVICGHSPIDKNTIHVRFTGKDTDTEKLCEFMKSEGYTERVFNFDEVRGKVDVTFVFLPGCNFDFRWFRFE
jgi:beta-galactosidase